MPQFYEVYGNATYSKSRELKENTYNSFCPYTNFACDCGGNRHQTKIGITEEHPLRGKFSKEISSVIPAVCAVGSSASDSWVVCPRRLFGFPRKPARISEFTSSLSEHEKEMLLAIGLPKDKELAVWPEVYLQYKDVAIDYHFDFVVAEIRRNVSLKEIGGELGVRDDAGLDELVTSARKGNYIKGRTKAADELEYLPDLNSPYILEVMTASTSGSNTAKGTNIASAFQDVILGLPHEGPGINKRQVWGRMATQLFAKTALAEKWGGKTIWVVQDQLLNNIERTTKMTLQSSQQAKFGEFINFAVMTYDNEIVGEGPKIKFDSIRTTSSGLKGEGINAGVDILLPKILPEKAILLSCMLRREPIAFIKL